MEYAQLQQKLAGKKFLVLGRAGMDIYPDPPGTKTQDALNFYSCLGGSSANIAVSLTKLGALCELVTCVSDDAIGRFVLNQLDHYGIMRGRVRSVQGECRTSLAIVESRIEEHQSVIYRNNAADFCMEEQDVSALDYGGYSALIATGTLLAAEPSRKASLYAFKKARQAGLALILDLDYRPYSWGSKQEAAEIYAQAAQHCDLVIGNDEEFGVMAGDYAKGFEFACSLAQKSERIIVYKMGHKGAITRTKNEEIRTGIYPITALKPTGAGDSFMGGFIASIAEGYPLRTAVLRGSACAAIVVGRVGCAPAMPTPLELEDFLAQHQEKQN